MKINIPICFGTDKPNKHKRKATSMELEVFSTKENKNGRIKQEHKYEGKIDNQNSSVRIESTGHHN